MNTTVEIRKKNTLIALKAFMNGGVITKVDVAERTGLTLMTVNTIVNSLKQRNILECCGSAGSSSGRKAALYRINPAVNHILGINIGVGSVSVAVSDLSLEYKETFEFVLDCGKSPDAGIERIKAAISEVMNARKLKPEDFLGLGIAVPGPVDGKTGVIRTLPNLKGWEGVEMKALFEESLGMPVFVQKDTFASALYLKRQLNITDKDIVALTIKGGIGTGLLLRGSLYMGENGIAGEIGHVSVNTDGPVCNCGNTGCLECYASDFSIIRDVRSRIADGEESDVPGASAGCADELNIGGIISAARRGDGVCRSSIMKAAKYLGIAVSNAMKFFDPACFIINCKWIKEIDGVSDAITAVVKERCTLIQREKINLMFHYEEYTYLNGALTLAADHALEDTQDNRLIG